MEWRTYPISLAQKRGGGPKQHTGIHPYMRDVHTLSLTHFSLPDSRTRTRTTLPFSPYLKRSVCEWDVERVQRPEDALHGLDRVTKHHLSIALALILREPILVDDLHLLDNGGLAGLSRPEQEELNLAPELLLLALDDLVQLFGPLHGGLVLGGHCAPHGAGCCLLSKPKTLPEQAIGLSYVRSVRILPRVYASNRTGGRTPRDQSKG